MNTHEATHDRIAEKLTAQYQILEAALSTPPGVWAKTPSKRLLAARTFATQISTSADASNAESLKLSDRYGAESFLTLAKYVLETYSNQRNLTTVRFSDNGRPFSNLAQLVLSYSGEIERGAASPFHDT